MYIFHIFLFLFIFLVARPANMSMTCLQFRLIISKKRDIINAELWL